MLKIHPFRAWRPDPDRVEQIACVPYDVIETDEARVLSEGRPDSFLHVIRPEIDLPADTGLYSDEVYETGAKNLRRMQEEGILIQDNTPRLYLYQQQMGTHTQTGLFTCVSVRDYDENRILKHELTRADKEDDRTRHILTQRAHAEPVMLTYKSGDAINQLVNKELSSSEPLYDFTAPDGVVHRLWQISELEAFVEAFRTVDRLYVADGHHRCKSASRVAEELRKAADTVDSAGRISGDIGRGDGHDSGDSGRGDGHDSGDSGRGDGHDSGDSGRGDGHDSGDSGRGDGHDSGDSGRGRDIAGHEPGYYNEECEFFPAVLIPMDEMRIMAYNRIIKKAPPDLLRLLMDTFQMKEGVDPLPVSPGKVCLYLNGTWFGIDLPDDPSENTVDSLDVSRLHRHLLLPLLGIENQRTDPNIGFVGGIRGTEELERLVDTGKADLAISMYPTSITELMAVADNDQLMPPKSTWFEPKLRSGLLVHTF